MNLPKFTWSLLCLLALHVGALAQSPPTRTAKGAFECEIVLDIYDAFYDWVEGKSYSGSGSPLVPSKKYEPGAVCVANLNDTNGSGMGIGNAGVDLNENNVQSTPIGRNEIDLMRLRVHKKDPDAPLTGTVTLTKVSGAVKLWSGPTKGTEIDISSPITIPVADLPKDYYIEATNHSSTMRDIEFMITFNGNEDRVRATAVWVEKTGHWVMRQSAPTTGSLPNLGGIVTFAINNGIAVDNSLYGPGEFRRQSINWDSDNNKDKKIGGRILMEWQVFPLGAEEVASFDMTRQRKTKTWSLNYIEWAFNPSIQNRSFPFEADVEPADAWDGEDVEEPNDDGVSNEDRVPINGFLYSWDAPATWQTYNYGGVSEADLSFRVSKNWFKEYVRVRSKHSSFGFVDSTLQGSRASVKFDWHCTYYTNKDNTYELSVDTDNEEYAFPRVFQGGNDIAGLNLFDMNVNLPGPITYEVGNISIIRWKDIVNGEKVLWVTRITDGPSIATEQELTIPESETVWNINIDGISVVLEEQGPITEDTFFLLSTFKTNANAKENLLAPGSYTNFVR